MGDSRGGEGNGLERGKGAETGTGTSRVKMKVVTENHQLSQFLLSKCFACLRGHRR